MQLCIAFLAHGHFSVAPHINPPPSSARKPSLCNHKSDRPSGGIAAKNVSYWWENGRIALRNVSLRVQPGELTMIVGENGCGKSTLLRTICGTLVPPKGSVNSESPCAYVHQNPDVQILFPTVGMDIGASVPKTADLSPQDLRGKVTAVMEAVGLTPVEDFLKTSSFRLSGGQKQRAVVAAALAMEPRSILFDEVTASMDPVNKAELLDRVRKIVTEQEIAALWVTHLLDELELADNIVIMNQGSIVAQGPMVEMMPQVYDLVDGV